MDDKVKSKRKKKKRFKPKLVEENCNMQEYANALYHQQAYKTGDTIVENLEHRKKKKRKRAEVDSPDICEQAEQFESVIIEEKTNLDEENSNADSMHHKKEKRRKGKPFSTEDYEKPQDENTEETPEQNIPKVPEDSAKILADAEFSMLGGRVSFETLKAIEDMGFTKMTEIQAKSIPHLLSGKNLVGNAKTGSGKTLAFLIPAIEQIHKKQFKSTNGTGCIIITPTRELAIQIYGVLEKVLKYHVYTYGLIIGGTRREAEAQKLQKGINILVATPGRLLDHLRYTPRFMFSNLRCLIIDEADRILDIGFEEDLKEIIRILPEKRQTMLFSATNTKKTEDLAKLAIKKDPVYVEVADHIDKATVDGLLQGYVISPSEKRFLLLCTFLRKTHKRNRKVMVFFSTCLSVKFHDMIFNSIDLPVMSIHGKKEQRTRTAIFFKFCEAKSGILLCTDVAARGLDIPAVDWIIQYDPPDDAKEYIHRVGRTARGEGGKGRALLILRPEEVGFLNYLREARVPVEKFDFDWNSLLNIQERLECLVNADYDIRETAKEAYQACIRSYLVHSLKEVFNVHNLDLLKLAKNFALDPPPRIELNINSKKMKKYYKKLNKYPLEATVLAEDRPSTV